MRITCIDRHGPDHGLSVEIESGAVTIVDWCEPCDDTGAGEDPPHLHTAIMSLRECLKHAAEDGQHNKSQRDRVITGALAYLGYWGGEVIYLEKDAHPCQHFMGACLVCEPWRVGDSVVVSVGSDGTGKALATYSGKVATVDREGGYFRLYVEIEGSGMTVQETDDGWLVGALRAFPQNCMRAMRDID